MPTIEDKEFGTISVRKVARSRSMRATIAPNGTLRLSVPSYAPLFMIKQMIARSRIDIRKLLETRPNTRIENGLAIGKSHTLILRESTRVSVRKQGLQLIVSLPSGADAYDSEIVAEVHKHTLAILRKEAKAHLPKRISHLASMWDYSYSSLRFTHASSRWGSCNSKKAISLNIALMNLPFELIDYVLIHELAHTKHLNHSKEFWDEVAKAQPDYSRKRKQLKQYNPHV